MNKRKKNLFLCLVILVILYVIYLVKISSKENKYGVLLHSRKRNKFRRFEITKVDFRHNDKSIR